MNSVESLLKVSQVSSSSFFKVFDGREEGHDPTSGRQSFVGSLEDGAAPVISLQEAIFDKLVGPDGKVVDAISSLVNGGTITSEQENMIVSALGDAIKTILDTMEKVDASSEATLTSLEGTYVTLIDSLKQPSSFDLTSVSKGDAQLKGQSATIDRLRDFNKGLPIDEQWRAMDSLKDKMSDYYREPMEFIRRQSDSIPSSLTSQLFSIDNTLSSIAKAFIDSFNNYQTQALDASPSAVARSDMPTADSISKGLLTGKIFEKAQEVVKDIGRGPGGSFNIKIHPQYLGEVTVSISHGRSGVSISIEASEDVASMIRSDLGSMPEGGDGQKNQRLWINGEVLGEHQESEMVDIEVKINNENTGNLIKLIL